MATSFPKTPWLRRPCAAKSPCIPFVMRKAVLASRVRGAVARAYNTLRSFLRISIPCGFRILPIRWLFTEHVSVDRNICVPPGGQDP